MKKGWPTKRLGDVVTRLTNGFVGPTRNIYHESGIPYLLARHVRNNNLLFDGRTFITEEFNRKNKKSMLKAGDVLLVQSGHIGHSAVVTEEHDGHNCHAMIVISPVKDAITGPYLSLFFNSPDMQRGFEEIRSGSTVPHLTCGAVKELQIPVPPLAEQQRIVGLLDKAFEGLATAKTNAEKNLQNARALFESHLQSVFTQRGNGWVENKLKSITTKIGSGATPRGGGESYKDEGISLIRSLNVHDLGFKYAKLAFLDDAQADELSNVEVQRRDVLLNITGASVARCAIVPDDVLPARVNQHVSIIRPVAEKLDADFLHYLLISRPYKDQLLKTGEEGGSTRQAITKAQIQDFTVEYPAKLKDQKIIVVKLDAMLAETQRLARIYERKLAALAELKKSLLHQAFTGEL